MLFTELGSRRMDTRVVLRTQKLKYLQDSHKKMSNRQWDMQEKVLLDI